MGFHPPLVELVGIVAMSASVVGVGMVRYREGRITLALGLALVSCPALRSAKSIERSVTKTRPAVLCQRR
jgi:hypothetical protein